MAILTEDMAAFGQAVVHPVNLGETVERICAAMNIPPALLRLGTGLVDPDEVLSNGRIGSRMGYIQRQYNESRGLPRNWGLPDDWAPTPDWALID